MYDYAFWNGCDELCFKIDGMYMSEYQAELYLDEEMSCAETNRYLDGLYLDLLDDERSWTGGGLAYAY